MTLSNPNPEPRFAAELGAFLRHDSERCILVDIGSRNGLDRIWEPLNAHAHFVCFEPDPVEAGRLRQSFSEAGIDATVHETALGEGNGVRTLYLTRYPGSSGFYEQNPAWTSRFRIIEQTVLRGVSTKTISFDHFIKEEKINHVDFMKIDVEGAELDIFRGAEDTIGRGDILGIKTEFWWAPHTKNEYKDSFADIDIFLREKGFHFFDINLHRYPRGTIPAGRITRRFDNPEARRLLQYRQLPYGQSWTGDALYFRDPVWERLNGQDVANWTEDRLLRLCALMDIYDYGDCAIEILEHFQDRITADTDRIREALTPTIDGAVLGYDEFVRISDEVKSNYRKRHLDLDDRDLLPRRHRRP